MDVEQVVENAYVLADEKHIIVNFNESEKDEVITFIMENR